MTENQRKIQDALATVSRVRRQRLSLTFTSVLVLVLLVAAVADRFLMFSGWERWIGWVGGLVLAFWLARRGGRVARTDAVELAHQVESDANETAPVVATSIDPSVRRKEPDAAGEILLEKLDQRAADALEAAPPKFSHLLRLPMALVGVAIVTLLVVVGWQGSQGLIRMLLPWTPSPYTSISLTGPTGPLPEGEAFTLVAEVSGVSVKELVLYREGKETPVSQGLVDENGKLSLSVEGVNDLAVFVARAGDGESAPLEIAPYLLPRIDEFEIEVIAPEYVTSDQVVETEPSFSAIRGSEVRYQVKLRAPAESVTFERIASPREDEFVSREERINARAVPKEETTEWSPVFEKTSPDGRIWEFQWSLARKEEILYRLVVLGEHGDKVRNEEPWRISVLGDSPPEIKITGHNGEEVIKRGNETVEFKLSAVDDVGLNEVWLVFRKPGQTHQREKVVLPPDARRSWSGAALLDLAPLDLKPFDIIAVHAEAFDGNTFDGPGVGRSEIVYLEIPLPESPDESGGGGGGGGGSPPINPLELQMEILRTTIVTPDDAPRKDRDALAFDQRQNADYTGQMMMALRSEGFVELADVLSQARAEMGEANRSFERFPPSRALPHVESALGFLIEAAKLLQEAGAQLPPADGSMDGVTFTLSKPKAASSESSEESESEESENGEGMSAEEREALANLMEEVKRQLAEQESLNESLAGSPAGEPSSSEQQAEAQQSLASDARSSAEQARGLPSASDSKSESQAAAEELERAAGLQEENAEALAEGDGEASSKLGAESAEALREALLELAGQLKEGDFKTDVRSPGFERLVNDYLRSISYE